MSAYKKYSKPACVIHLSSPLPAFHKNILMSTIIYHNSPKNSTRLYLASQNKDETESQLTIYA